MHDDATGGGGDAVIEALRTASPATPVAIGRYDVVGRLGQGGMGTVYDAIDRDRGIRVALKTLSVPDVAAGVRLKREFRNVADVAHPSLAPVYELGTERGLWFFTMERIDGVAFTRWARGPSSTERATRRLPVTRAAGDEAAPAVSTQSTTHRQVLERAAVEPVAATPPRCAIDALRAVLADLVRGLMALHDAGLWHGDVKPDNVLVRDDGRVVVVDFGIAERVGVARAQRGPAAGTPDFMSSEQLVGAGVGPASDWYAVGTMLYEALTGRLPFEGDSLLDLYFKKTHQTPPAPRELVPELPADLSDVCLALLDPRPEHRPGGAELLRVFAGDDEARARLRARPARATFIGRRRELRALEQAYGLARRGRRVVVHAHGPSGIGKSSMLRSFCRGVADIDDAWVLSGRCYERESVPYNAFDGIIDELAARLADAPDAVAERLPAWIGELAQVFPALRSVPAIAARAVVSEPALEAAELRRRAWHALRELLAVALGPRTLVLAIDDLQWADADSARLLEALVRDPGEARLMIVASYRTAEASASPVLRDYFATSDALADPHARVDLALGPLPAAEAEQLARATLRELGGAAGDDRLRFLAAEAAGVPFFIEELARYLAVQDDAQPDGGRSLDDAIRARVHALPADQRALIEVAAIADAPVPQGLLFTAAGLGAGALPALLALRRASLVTWSGAGGDDPVAPYHDRIREAVAAGLDEPARAAGHLALGRALAARHLAQPDGPWVFEAVRHLHAAGAALGDAAERHAAAGWALEAGRRARQAAAAPLAFACFERGIELLGADGWARDYPLALGLHGGAAEAGYLAAAWDTMTLRCAQLKAHARDVLDQLVAWEVEIDARCGRHAYAEAIDAGMDALALLGVTLPRDPGADEVGAAFARALEALTAIGPDGLAALPDVSDPSSAAAMRLQVRLAPVAYFARPRLLPVIACDLVTTSVARGLSSATPYALALFGIVLNVAGMYPVAHAWGTLAVRLLDRWPDRRLEAATRHVAYNLVCAWMVPLATILAPLREVWSIGRRTGDLEYAAYAAHGYVHNAMYAARPLAPLREEARTISAEMRAIGQVNALHVHRPFEQLLEALTGHLPGAPCLDGPGFVEADELAAATRDGSRSGICIVRLAMGLARFYLGDPRDASAQLEHARDHLDAAPSVWHMPILHQHAALAACAILADVSPDERAHLRARIGASLEVLRGLAAHAPVNFAHRVHLIEAEQARVAGDRAAALAALAAAQARARDGGWLNDLALAHELEARVHAGVDDAAARRALVAARDGYAAWGAVAKAAQLDARLAVA